MAVTAGIALVGPILGLRLLIRLLGLGGAGEQLFSTLFWALGITFAGWLLTLMTPVFTILGVDTIAKALANGILL
jgi:hypothetical protein